MLCTEDFNELVEATLEAEQLFKYDKNHNKSKKFMKIKLVLIMVSLGVRSRNRTLSMVQALIIRD